jgi:dipeptidyl aminopeptidase/acylaminoacyl peptidase
VKAGSSKLFGRVVPGILFAGIVVSIASAATDCQRPPISMQIALSSGDVKVTDLNWLGNNWVLIGSRADHASQVPIVTRWDLATLRGRRIASGEYPSSSPDGGSIVYLDDKQWKLASTRENKVIAIGDQRLDKPTVISPPKWSRNGRFIAIIEVLRSPPSTLSQRMPADVGGVHVVDVGAVADAVTKSSVTDRTVISIIDIKFPQKSRAIELEESDAYYGDWGLGSDFYFVAMQSYWTGEQAYTALKRLDATTMAVSDVFRFSGFMQSAEPRVSPDGAEVALAVDVDNARWTDYVSLVLVNVRSAKIVRITKEPFVGGYCWVKGGRGLFFTGRHGGLSQIYRATTNGQVERVSREARRYFDLQCSLDGRWVSYQTEDGYGRRDIRVRATENNEERVVAVLADPRKEFGLGEFRQVRWRTTDDLDIWGWLVLPSDFDANRKYPLYVDVHGGGPGSPLSLAGPLSSALIPSPMEWHAWASLGYVVFVPDMRSSGEYGPQVAAARYAVKDWDFGGIQKDVEDIETGTRWVLQQGYIDPKRVAVFGHSAGGARVNLLLARSTLYAAGVVDEPIESGSMAELIENTTGASTGVRFDEHFLSRGITFAENPAVYTGGFLFDGYKSKTPTLILVGNPEKGALNPTSAEVLFSMLRQYNIPARMLRYTDDAHNPATIESALQRYDEIRRWLDLYLPGAAREPTNTGADAAKAWKCGVK